MLFIVRVISKTLFAASWHSRQRLRLNLTQTDHHEGVSRKLFDRSHWMNEWLAPPIFAGVLAQSNAVLTLLCTTLVFLFLVSCEKCDRNYDFKLNTIIISQNLHQIGAEFIQKIESTSLKNCYSECCSVSHCTVGVFKPKVTHFEVTQFQSDKLMLSFQLSEAECLQFYIAFRLHQFCWATEKLQQRGW